MTGALRKRRSKVFATGIREAYDLCWHSNGQLYAGVNQNDTGERSPENTARQLPAINERADEPLIRIVEGKYSAFTRAPAPSTPSPLALTARA